jgi:hypothetical protein
VTDALAGAAVSDQREGWGDTDWATQVFPESAIHNVAHGLIPLGRTEFRTPKEIVVNNEGGPHTYDHICETATLKARPLVQRPMLVAPVGGTTGVLRGSKGATRSSKINKLLIPLPAQANSSPVRSAI